MSLFRSPSTFFSDKKPSPGWFWQSILLPFLITRFCWVLVGYYATGNYLPNPTYEKYFDRGFFLTRLFPVDIFTRWDAGAYFSILSNGYAPSSEIRTVFSNLAFFPLYPYLVKSLGWLGLKLPDGFYVIFGVLLSNLFFLAAAVLLFRFIIVELNFSDDTACRTLGLLYVFPTAFIFSCFYTESLFLFLTVLAFNLAFRNRWKWAALAGFFFLLTRSQGLVAWGILILLYLERKQWRLSAIRADFSWLILAPVGLIGHFYYLYQMTGEPLAPFVAMTAWGRANTSILANLAENLASSYLDIYKIDLVMIILFIAASFYILSKWPIKSIGLYALALSIMPIASGLLVSASRYLLLVFPVFILMGKLFHQKGSYEAVRAIFFTTQIVYFTGWVNYYWIV